MTPANELPTTVTIGGDLPFEEAVETLDGMKADGLIRHIGLSNVTVEQLRTAMSMTEIAAVTVHYTSPCASVPRSVRSPKMPASCSRPGTRAPSPAAPTAHRSTP
jgi:Aldo/keto reductase family